MTSDVNKSILRRLLEGVVGGKGTMLTLADLLWGVQKNISKYNTTWYCITFLSNESGIFFLHWAVDFVAPLQIQHANTCRFCRFWNSWFGKGTVTRISGQFKSQERRPYPLVCWHRSEPVSPRRQTCSTKIIYKESNVKVAVERTQVQRLSCAVVVAAVAWSSCAFRFVMFACVVLCFFFSISGHVCW